MRYKDLMELGKAIMVQNQCRKKIHADADDDGGWITVNGTHIHLNENGEADKGPAAVKNAINGDPDKKAGGKESSNPLSSFEELNKFLSSRDMTEKQFWDLVMMNGGNAIETIYRLMKMPESGES